MFVDYAVLVVAVGRYRLFVLAITTRCQPPGSL
jgi:hypothetical protein